MKQVQLRVCEMIRRDSIAVDSVKKEIADSERAIKLDLCPIVRFFIWSFLASAITLIVMAGALGLAWAIIQLFLLPFAEFLEVLKKIAMIVGFVVIAVVGVVAFVFTTEAAAGFVQKAIPRKAEKLKTEEEIQAEAAAEAAAPPENKLGPVIKAWAHATHERFCIKLEVIPESIAA